MAAPFIKRAPVMPSPGTMPYGAYPSLGHVIDDPIARLGAFSTPTSTPRYDLPTPPVGSGTRVIMRNGKPVLVAIPGAKNPALPPHRSDAPFLGGSRNPYTDPKLLHLTSAQKKALAAKMHPGNVYDPHSENSGHNANNQTNVKGQGGQKSGKPAGVDPRVTALASSLQGLGKLGTANTDYGISDIMGIMKGIQTPSGDYGLGALAGQLKPYQVDPEVYANSIITAKYGPVIGELHRAMSNAEAQGGQNIKDISGWYGQLGRNEASRATEGRAENDRIQNAIGSVAPSLISALGLEANPDVAASVGATSDIASDYQRMIAGADDSFARNMQSVTGLAGNSALVNERNRQSTQMGDLEGQLTDLQSAKGAELASTLSDARKMNTDAMNTYVGQASTLAGARAGLDQQGFTDRMTRLQMLGTLAGSRADIAHTQRADQLAQVNTQIASAMAPIGMQTAIAGLEGAQADKNLTLAKANAIKQAAGQPIKPWGKLTSGDRSQLYSQILKTVQPGVQSMDPKTNKPIMNTEKAVKQVGAMLRTAGYDPATNPQAKAFAFNILIGMGINPKNNWYPG